MLKNPFKELSLHHFTFLFRINIEMFKKNCYLDNINIFFIFSRIVTVYFDL